MTGKGSWQNEVCTLHVVLCVEYRISPESCWLSRAATATYLFLRFLAGDTGIESKSSKLATIQLRNACNNAVGICQLKGLSESGHVRVRRREMEIRFDHFPGFLWNDTLLTITSHRLIEIRISMIDVKNEKVVPSPSSCKGTPISPNMTNESDEFPATI
jgi:hypothetical protein